MTTTDRLNTIARLTPVIVLIVLLELLAAWARAEANDRMKHVKKTLT